MEQTESAVVIPLDADWNDVGAWSSLWEISPQDDKNNVIIGDIITENVTGSYLRAEHRLVAAIGLENFIVVETADAILIAHQDSVQEVKKIVSHLKAAQRDEALLHRKVYRPWGSYETIDIDHKNRYQVKHIIVNPSASLSLQMHYHRSEHWIIVKGTAQITRNEETFLLGENQSTYIPFGTKHRLTNPGKLPLEIIEIQSGGYLGEDDIIRYDDAYGRHD